MSRVGRLICAFNRVVVALLSLAALVGAVKVALAPDQALSVVAAELTTLRGVPVASLWPTLEIVALVAAVILLLEVWPRRGSQVFEAQVDGGTVEYPAAMIARTVEKELATIDGIQRSRVVVGGHQRKVDLLVRLSTLPEDDSQELAEQTAGCVRDKVNGLGLELGRLRLSIQPGSERGVGKAREAVAA